MKTDSDAIEGSHNLKSEFSEEEGSENSLGGSGDKLDETVFGKIIFGWLLEERVSRSRSKQHNIIV